MPHATADGAALVSVIITTYNHAQFLGEAIKSVLAQTIRPFEVIVVDDGSTDDPAAVVRRYPQLRLIRQGNQGLAAARNTGWRASGGDYLVFLDADDRLLPSALAANLRRLAEWPECAFAYGAYRTIDVAGRVLRSPVPQGVGADAYECFLRGNCVGMHATVMYRRKCLEEVGGFDAALPACEDYDLYLRLARRHRVVASVECVAEYRRHDSNMSRNIPMMLETALQVLRRQRRHAKRDRRWRRAFRAGIGGWKSYYAANQLFRARELVKASGWRHLPWRPVAKLFRKAPVAVVRAAGEGARELVRIRAQHAFMRPVALGDLRRVDPISVEFGYDRGTPVDRRYIEDFLLRHAGDIRGRVLEIGDRSYTTRFGGARVTRSDVLHVRSGNPIATLVGDLATGDGLPEAAFDCIVLTQTLHLVFDMREAVANLHRMLKPGGVLLATVPGVSAIDRGEWGASWFWSLSPAAMSRLLEERFGGAEIAVTAYGNVLAAIAFLHGLAQSELGPTELDLHDPRYPVIVAARAVRRDAAGHEGAAAA